MGCKTGLMNQKALHPEVLAINQRATLTTDQPAAVPQTESFAAARSALRTLERIAPVLLGVIIVLWVALVFAASVYKYEMFGQGYDQVDFEQAIWNTVHGHIMADSRFNFTDSIFGMDWMPMLFFFVPFYALVQSPHTLFFMQIVGASLGAIPLYWLARDRLKNKIAGLGFAVAYLLYPTLLYGVMNPFQVRLFSTTLLLFAFYFYEKESRSNWQLFGAFSLLAMLARTDVSLVVAMFGVYGLLTRRRWQWVVPPLVVGFAYFAISTFLIVPSFLHPDALQGPAGQNIGYMACWPCGHNPVLAYYGHLGGTFGEIAKYIVTHPVEVAQLIFSGPKLGYIVSLLLPLMFLPLLSPRPLVLGVPILVLNLLSLRSSQFSYQTHYSLLLIPGLFAAAIYGLDNLSKWLASARSPLRTRDRQLIIATLVLLLVGWAVIMQVPFKNPVVRAVRFHETQAKGQCGSRADKYGAARCKGGRKLLHGAPHLLPRRFIYNFPPAPYSPYNFGTEHQSDRFVELDYILVDPDASALEVNRIGGETALEDLRKMPDWQQVASKQNLFLFKHKSSGG